MQTTIIKVSNSEHNKSNSTFRTPSRFSRYTQSTSTEKYSAKPTRVLHLSGSREPSNNNGLSKTMIPDDIMDLTWYFSDGITMYTRSVQGAMLERAWLYSSPPTGRFKRGLELTAQPRKSYQSSEAADHGCEVAESLTLKHGEVSRRLALLAPKHAAALKLMHGDAGASFARLSCGAVGALLLIVPAGQKLIALMQAKSIQDLSATETLRNIILMADLQSKHKQTLTTGLVQAQSLYSAASSAYAGTK